MTELEPLAGHRKEIDCHNRSVDRSIKSKKGNVLLHWVVKVSGIPFRTREDRFYRYIGVNFTFGLLQCRL